MYDISLCPLGLGSVISYSKSDSLDEAVRNAIYRLFPEAPFLDRIRTLRCGSDLNYLQDAVVSYKADFNITESEGGPGYFFFGGGAVLPDVICLEVNEIDIPLASMLNKPQRIIQPVTIRNLQGISSIILVRPRAVKEVLNFANMAFKKSIDSGELKFTMLEEVLTQLSIVYRGLIYTNAFYTMFQSLDAFVNTDNIQKVVEARYGRNVVLNGVSVGMNYNSTFPIMCHISKDADSESIKSLFYFIELLGQFTDTDQMLYGEFGINPSERINALFSAK